MIDLYAAERSDAGYGYFSKDGYIPGGEDFAYDDDEEDFESCRCHPISFHHERAWQQLYDRRIEASQLGTSLSIRDYDKFYIELPFKRPHQSVNRALRLAVAERDNWNCGFCGGHISSERVRPHPLSLVADHYPVKWLDYGPSIKCNLRAAHEMCNNPAFRLESLLQYSYTSGEQMIVMHAIYQCNADRKDEYGDCWDGCVPRWPNVKEFPVSKLNIESNELNLSDVPKPIGYHSRFGVLPDRPLTERQIRLMSLLESLRKRSH